MDLDPQGLHSANGGRGRGQDPNHSINDRERSSWRRSRSSANTEESDDRKTHLRDVRLLVQDLEDHMDRKNVTIDAMGLQILSPKVELKKAKSREPSRSPRGKRAQEACHLGKASMFSP